jgi:hypothetical protein
MEARLGITRREDGTYLSYSPGTSSPLHVPHGTLVKLSPQAKGANKLRCFRLARAIAAALLMFVAVLVSACGSGSSASCAAVTGQTKTSTGSSAGADNYSLGLGSGYIRFSNLNLTFYTGTAGDEMVDAGSVCLASVTSWPGGTSNRITAVLGDTYIVRFRTVINGVTTYSYAKFIVDSYQGGVVTVTYVPNL